MIVIFAERDNQTIKKSSLEALSYGQDLASMLSTSCAAVVVGADNGIQNLGTVGANRTVFVDGPGLDTFTPEGFSSAMHEACKHLGATIAIIPSTYCGKSIAGQLAVKMDAACTSGIVALADVSNGFSVRKSCFSNKAFTQVSILSERKVLGLIPNSYEVKTFDLVSEIETISLSSNTIKTKSLGVDRVKGKIPLTEAELVVSAGRGLKGPENWSMIEELAEVLGAATACSKPVSDMEWRPHGEHVGQTGITIKPNLYIAIGISGAIQHLAGVSSSKVICVINTDPEAPFFKAADYGIVGDAFEVVPKLIERARELTA